MRDLLAELISLLVAGLVVKAKWKDKWDRGRGPLAAWPEWVARLCNYVSAESAAIFFMALAFFGRSSGVQLGGQLGYGTEANRRLSGSVLNACESLSSITTPIAIGYIIDATGSFSGALVCGVVHAYVAMICYLFVVGKIERIVLK